MFLTTNFLKVIFSLLLMVFSVFGVISVFSYSAFDSCLSTISATNIENKAGIIGAYIADIFIQLFGITTFILFLILFIWGWKILFTKQLLNKTKFIELILFIIFATIICTVLSTTNFGTIILQKAKIKYLAGGSIGYLLTKFCFSTLIQNPFWIQVSVFLLTIASCLLLKRLLFVNFESVLIKAPRIMASIRDIKIPHICNNEIEEQQNNVPEKEKTQEHRPKIVKNGTDIYKLPHADLLDKHTKSKISNDDMASRSNELQSVLEEFGIHGEILNVKTGPVVTLFEFRPAPGIKTSRVISLSDDIARSMSATSARISIIPGQNAIGIELPNKNRQTVFLKELLTTDEFENSTCSIPIALGKDINGTSIIVDLAKMPHLLVAGTTGSGKSVSINSMILSILYKFVPDECKLIMVDPKMLELSVYDEIPHLLTPVVTDPKQAVFALKWAVSEMESRYKKMSQLGVRNIDGFNKKIKEAKENCDLLVRKVQTGFDQETGRPVFETQQLEFTHMPYIVVIVDEMADLMLVAGKDIEAAVQRLAQMARAAGIHLIMATQRPSVDVITGTIKANFPTRVSFQVTSKIDSRTILGEQGAEQLLGHGDMLYMAGGGRITRVHGPFVSDSEVERIVSYIKEQKEPTYVDIITNIQNDDFSQESNGDEDDMYKKALDIIINEKKTSISYLQRRLQIGYNRAARIIEEMEEKGVLSPPNNSGKREILI